MSDVPAAPRRRILSIEGRDGPAELAALEWGDAERPLDLIFLHANGFNALTYRTILAPLGETLRVLAYDQQGHGRSALRSDIESRTNWRDLRDDLLAVLRALDPPAPVVLGGHSMGGTTALMAAACAPQRVKALVLFDPVLFPPRPPSAHDSAMVAGALRRKARFPSRAVALAAYRGRGAFRAWPDQALADYVADGFRDLPDGEVELACPPAWEASSYRVYDGADSWSAMAQVTAPVRLLRAEQDSTCPVETRAPFNPANPRVRVELIAGTTHFLPIERPDLARAALLEAAGLG